MRFCRAYRSPKYSWTIMYEILVKKEHTEYMTFSDSLFVFANSIKTMIIFILLLTNISLYLYLSFAESQSVWSTYSWWTFQWPFICCCCCNVVSECVAVGGELLDLRRYSGSRLHQTNRTQNFHNWLHFNSREMRVHVYQMYSIGIQFHVSDVVTVAFGSKKTRMHVGQRVVACQSSMCQHCLTGDNTGNRTSSVRVLQPLSWQANV